MLEPVRQVRQALERIALHDLRIEWREETRGAGDALDHFLLRVEQGDADRVDAGRLAQCVEVALDGLAAALGAGMRAVTVKVSQEQGVAGFVFPGDRVDVVLAQKLSIKEGSAYPDDELYTAETIVRNVRVLATDQRYDAEDETGKTPVRTFGSVTLEATPEIAEKIAVAQNMGQLSLALRPLAENSGDLEAAIASGEVNVPAGGGTAAEKKMLAEAAARPTSAKSSATTGGDVSRFWVPVRGRVSAPRQPQQQQSYSGAPVSTGSAAPQGPVVRVTRGDKVTEITVGGK